MSVLRLKLGYTVKYSLSPWEINQAPPSAFPPCSCYISLYIPSLVIIQIQYYLLVKYFALEHILESSFCLLSLLSLRYTSGFSIFAILLLFPPVSFSILLHYLLSFFPLLGCLGKSTWPLLCPNRSVLTFEALKTSTKSTLFVSIWLGTVINVSVNLLLIMIDLARHEF